MKKETNDHPQWVVPVATLRDALATLRHVINEKSIMPAYECVKMVSDGKTLTLTGGNDGQSITLTLPLTLTPATVVTAMYPLYRYLLELPDQPITMHLEDNRMTVRTGTGQCRLPLVPPADYPVPSRKGEDELLFSISDGEAARLLADNIKTALPFVHKNNGLTDPFDGVWLNYDTAGYRAVASDKRRIIFTPTVSRTETAELDKDSLLLMPNAAKYMAMILSKVGPSSSSMRLMRRGTWVTITCDNLSYGFVEEQVNPIPWDIPLGRVLGESINGCWNVQASDIRAALDRLSALPVMSGELGSFHVLTMSYASGSLTVAFEGQEEADASEALPCDGDGPQPDYQLLVGLVNMRSCLKAGQGEVNLKFSSEHANHGLSVWYDDGGLYVCPMQSSRVNA